MTKLYFTLGLTALLILVILAIYISLNQKNVKLSPGSPEHTVQKYLQHISEDQIMESYSLITDSTKEECTYISFLSSLENQSERIKDKKIQLVNTYTENNEAIVIVKISELNYSILSSPYENNYKTQYRLNYEGDKWLIASMEFPIYCSTERGSLNR